MTPLPATVTPPPATPTVTSTPAPPTPSPTATPRPSTIELDEASLTTAARERFVGQPLAETPFGTAYVQDVWVRLHDGLVTVEGNVQAGWFYFPLLVTGAVSARSGRGVVDLRRAEVADVALPEGARLELEQALQTHVDQQLAARGMRVESVRIEAGRVQVVAVQT